MSDKGMRVKKSALSQVYSQNYQVVKNNTLQKLKSQINPETNRTFTGLEMLAVVNHDFDKNGAKTKRDLRPVDQVEATALFEGQYKATKTNNAKTRRQYDFERRRARVFQPLEPDSYLYRPVPGQVSGPMAFDFQNVDDGSRWRPGSGLPSLEVDNHKSKSNKSTDKSSQTPRRRKRQSRNPRSK